MELNPNTRTETNLNPSVTVSLTLSSNNKPRVAREVPATCVMMFQYSSMF